MSDHDADSDLNEWLRALDVGGHYSETEIYRKLVVRHVVEDAFSEDLNTAGAPEAERFGDRQPISAEPVLIPEKKFNALVRTTHNRFIEVIREGDLNLSYDLEEALPKHLDFLSAQIESLSDKIESLKEIRDRFARLAERFKTIDTAAEAEALPDSLQQHQPTEPPPEFDSWYDATELFKVDVDCPVYRGDSSPLRIAAHARKTSSDLRERRLPKQRAKATARLRLAILQYVRRYYQITGISPEKLTKEEVEEEAETARKAVRKDRRGGRPAQVAPGRDEEARIPILNDLLSDPNNWRFKDGVPSKPNYPDIYEQAREKDPELFLIESASLRTYVKRKFEIGKRRFELKKRLIARYRTNLPDKPSPGQTVGLSGLS